MIFLKKKYERARKEKMNKRTMNGQMIEEFGSYLENEEKSPATLEKYLRDVRAFWHFAGEQHVTRELVRRWKDFLVERKYAVRSVNSMLASVNSFWAGKIVR